jgi:hypothetical protein
MPNTVPAAAEGLPDINHRKALSLTGTTLVAALGAVAATSCHPLPAVADETAAEPIAARVRRLGRELAAALDEYAAQDGQQWKAHVWPQSVFASQPVWLENLTADVSGIMALFREWEAHYHAGGDDVLCNAHMKQCCEIELRMMAMPAFSAADFAAKYVVASGYGDFIVEGDLMREALRLAGSCHPHSKLIEMEI